MTFDPDPAAPQPPPRPSRWRLWSGLRTWRWRRPGSAAATGSRWIWRWSWRVLLVLLILYYPVGALIVQNIDDDPQFAPQGVAPGESRAVAVAADLVNREVDVHTWTPMLPFFTPGGITKFIEAETRIGLGENDAERSGFENAARVNRATERRW